VTGSRKSAESFACITNGMMLFPKNGQSEVTRTRRRDFQLYPMTCVAWLAVPKLSQGNPANRRRFTSMGVASGMVDARPAQRLKQERSKRVLMAGRAADRSRANRSHAGSQKFPFRRLPAHLAAIEPKSCGGQIAAMFNHTINPMNPIQRSDGLTECTSEEVAAWLSEIEGHTVTLLEVRRIEAQALRKLRSEMVRRGLRPDDLLV
jgi:hypothetical protein